MNAKSLHPDLISYFGLSNEELERAQGLRFKNTTNFQQYLEGKHLEKSAFEILTEKDYLIEEFFLSLRTDHGIKSIEKFEKILVTHFSEKLKRYEEQGFIEYWEH